MDWLRSNMYDVGGGSAGPPESVNSFSTSSVRAKVNLACFLLFTTGTWRARRVFLADQESHGNSSESPSRNLDNDACDEWFGLTRFAIIRNIRFLLIAERGEII